MPAPIAIKYRAFISYSDVDARWAKWLHESIEGFRIDKDIVGRITATGSMPSRLEICRTTFCVILTRLVILREFLKLAGSNLAGLRPRSRVMTSACAVNESYPLLLFEQLHGKDAPFAR